MMRSQSILLVFFEESVQCGRVQPIPKSQNPPRRALRWAATTMLGLPSICPVITAAIFNPVRRPKKISKEPLFAQRIEKEEVIYKIDRVRWRRSWYFYCIQSTELWFSLGKIFIGFFGLWRTYYVSLYSIR